MCLMVYLGSDAPVAGFGKVPPGEVGLDPGPHRIVPPPLAEKAHVYRVCDRLDSDWNCSCIFQDVALPWQDPDTVEDPGGQARQAAFEALRRIASAALAVDPKPLLYSGWDGEEALPVAVERVSCPDDLLAERFIFDDVNDGGQGGTPPVLIRLGEPSDV